MSEPPYRSPAPTSIEIAWRTEADARRGRAELVALLEREGVELDPRTAVELGPAALALTDAEGDTRVYVGWEIARIVNRALEASRSTKRLHRAGVESTTWLLLAPEEADARRARGEEALTSPPPVLSPRERRSMAIALGGALLAVGALIATTSIAGEHIVLVATIAAIVAGSAIGRRIAPEGASRARRVLATVLVDGPLLLPIGRLAWLGEFGLLLALLGALALAAFARWVAVRMGTTSARAI